MILTSAVDVLLLGVVMPNECIPQASPEEQRAGLATVTAKDATFTTLILQDTITAQRLK